MMEGFERQYVEGTIKRLEKMAEKPMHKKLISDIANDECDGEIRKGYLKQWIIAIIKENRNSSKELEFIERVMLERIGDFPHTYKDIKTFIDIWLAKGERYGYNNALMERFEISEEDLK